MSAYIMCPECGEDTYDVDKHFCDECEDKKDKAIKQQPTVPTVPGWYWVKIAHCKPRIYHISVGDIAFKSFAIDSSMVMEKFETCHFSGPIPLPEGWEG